MMETFSGNIILSHNSHTA